MGPCGLGLKSKTITDYLNKKPQTLYRLGIKGLAEFDTTPKSQWRGYRQKNKSGRPANFRLECISGLADPDPFAPKHGNYYQDPARYNDLRRIRHQKKKAEKANQLDLFQAA
ncbi:MAG: hypothetical protein ACYCPA_11850 [Acidithiobacillus sp.]